MLKKFNYIFDRKQKFELCINIVLALLAGLFELLGVSALLPLVNVILDPTAIDTNTYYALFADIFDAHDITKFVVMFSVLLIVLYVLKNLYLIKRYEIQLNFMYSNRRNCHTSLWSAIFSRIISSMSIIIHLICREMFITIQETLCL